MFKLMGWKDYKNNWDRKEITADIYIILIIVIGTYIAYLYNA